MAFENPSNQPEQQPTRRAPSLPLLLVGGLLIYTGLALVNIPINPPTRPATVFVVLGIALFLAAVGSFSRLRLPEEILRRFHRLGQLLEVEPEHILLVGVAPLLSYGAWLASGQARTMILPLLAVGLWLGAIGLTIALGTFAQENRRVDPWPKWEIGLVGLLFLFALALRLPNLDRVPWLLSGDEASVGLSAVDFLEGRRTNIFDVAWFSFPSFYFLLPAASIKLFGQTIQALRLPSALAGALTVAAVYWYARTALGRGVALGSAFYLAVFHFHIHFSRIGLNNIWDGLFIVLVSGTLWNAYTTNRRLLFVLAGLAFGWSFYFFVTSRTLLILIPVWLIIAWLTDRSRLRSRLPGLFFMALSALVVALPLGLFFLDNPDHFFAPLNRSSILGQWLDMERQRTGLSTGRILWLQFQTSALVFTSANLRYWYQIDHPMLFPLAATLFLLGLLLMVGQIRALRHIWLGLWLLSAIGAGALSESTPAAQRYVFAAPAIAVLVTMPLVQITRWIRDHWPSSEMILYLAASLLLLLAARTDLDFYFNDYTPSKRFSDLNTEAAQSIGFFLSQRQPKPMVYFFGHPRMGFQSIPTLPYLVPEVDWQDVISVLDREPDWILQGPTSFIFLPERRQEMAWVREQYPDGQISYRFGHTGDLLFIVYEVG